MNDANMVWVGEIDRVAARANDHLILMERSFTNGSGPDVAGANALRSIATQLAYANTVAAAEFYTRHLMEGS